MTNGKIAPGLKGHKETIVCEHNAAAHVGSFSTPAMIMLMEHAAMVAIDPHLGSDQASVGYEVNVRHIAPAPLGATIVAYSELTDMERNRLTFKVEAYYGETKIGEGTHRRAIINTDPTKK